MRIFSGIFSILAVVLSVVGAALSGYLLWLHASHESPGFCAVGSVCADAIHGRWSELPPRDPASVAGQPGVPVALLGVWYFSFFATWTVFLGLSVADRTWWRYIPHVVATGGVIGSGVFIWIMLAKIGALCPLCCGVHGINAALFACVLLTCIRSHVASAMPASFEEETSRSFRPGGRLIAAIACLQVMIAVAAWAAAALVESRVLNRKLARDLEHVQGDTDVAEWLYFREDRYDIPVGDDEPILAGVGEAPVTLVVFSDIFCSYCQQYERMVLDEIVPLFKGRLRVVYKHFPLCTDCNSGLDESLHENACEAAQVAEAAFLQGGITAFLKARALLAKMDVASWTYGDTEVLAERLNLDADRLEKDRLSDAVRQRIDRDVKLARSLEVDGTPQVFLEGRKLSVHNAQLIGFWKLMASRVTGESIGREAPTELAGADVTDTKPLEADLEEGRRRARVVFRRYDENQDMLLHPEEWQRVPALLRPQSYEVGESGISPEQFARAYAAELRRERLRNSSGDGRSEAHGLKIGQAVQLVGTTLTGESFELSQLRDKVVLIQFWSTRCPGCEPALEQVARLHDLYHAKGFEVVGISTDRETQAVRDFLNTRQHPWIELRSETGEEYTNAAISTYEIRRVPVTVLLDHQGIVAHVTQKPAKLAPMIDALIRDQRSTASK